MTAALHLLFLFIAKMLDNAFSTIKTILVQRNHPILAGLSLAVSSYLYLIITKNIVTADSQLSLVVVSVASGVGCCVAVLVSNKLSKERTYVNVVMSDDKAGMQAFRDFLATHHITNVATDSYTIDWDTKSIAVTAYAETKEQSRLINEYIEESGLKCKRMIQKT